MQYYVDGKPSPDQEDDQDSLFGSPSISPGRGRSPSPGLALPSSCLSTQNVGTIALPGSQHCSELPVTPLALSLNYALNEYPQRPPARSTTATSSERSTSSSRASSTGPGNRPKKRTRKVSKSKESTPRPPPLEINLPDPSGPIPANFLRNQSTLLGTAGLVGGVKPSKLSMHRQRPGTVASNPIVIDEDERVPHYPSQASIQLSLEKLDIDPRHLPTPSKQEIISMLMEQKDFLLVLQSISKLAAEMDRQKTMYSPEPAPFTSFRRTPHSFQPSGPANVNVAQFSQIQNHSVVSDASTSPKSPSLKKRKRRLIQVPAGAVDWDVPYPFLEGQGPESYRTNWQRERGKQLISQLVTLVKDAIRKAATRKYLRNLERYRMLELHRTLTQPMASKRPDEPKVHGHYRPSTITYGLQGEAAVAARAQVQKVLTDASNSVKASTGTSPAQASASRTSTPMPSVPFDQLVSFILAVIPSSELANCGASLSGDIDGNSGAQTGSPLPTIDVSPQNPDPGSLGNLVNIFLQIFPISTQTQDSPSTDHNTSGPPSQPDSSRSTPSSGLGFSSCIPSSPDTIPVESRRYDFDMFNTDQSTSSTPAPSSHVTPQPEYSSQKDDTPHVPEQDFIIDPALLAISTHPASVASAIPTSLMPLPSLRGSPTPYSSSFGDVDPSTPNSVAWDTNNPEVFTGSGADVFLTENGLVGGGYRGGITDQGDVDEHASAFVEARSADKGKGKAIDDFRAQVSPPPISVQSHIRHHYVASPSSSSSPSLPTPDGQRPISKLQTSKSDIMKRAAKRKKQLVKAITNIRTQLWETTIEQGVLLHMNSLCTHTT